MRCRIGKQVQFLEFLRVLCRGSGEVSWGVVGGRKARTAEESGGEGKPPGAAVGILHSPEAAQKSEASVSTHS